MILLGIIVLLLGGYLVYALAHAEAILMSRTQYRRSFICYSWF